MSKDIQEEEYEEIEETFKLFDKDGDGNIDIEELEAFLKSLGHNPSQTDLENVFDEADTDNNGLIDFDEFVALLTRPEFRNSGGIDLEKVFEMFDKDGNGKISAEEVCDAMKHLNIDISLEECNELVKEADVDGDEEIDYEEFSMIVKNL